MDLNPIVAREVRTRWRGRNSFLLVMGYTALIAVVIGFVYASVVDGAASSLERMAQAGRNLFLIATGMQALAWMLLAPTLTATSIAGERERGLLEGLQLSPLTSWQIVCGKLLSSLTFALLIIAVSLPITAVSFVLGGVSPSDFFIALLLHLTGATLGACVGLLCSAWSRRGNIALRMTFVLIVVWGLSFNAPDFISYMLSPFTRGGAVGDTVAVVGDTIGQIFILGHPLYMTLATLGDNDLSLNAFNPATTGIPIPGWLLAIIAQLFLSCLWLWLATRALRRPFAEQYWIERKSKRGKRGQSTLEHAGSETADSGRAPRMWWEIPVVSHWPFANPVLQREARGKFRMRQAPFWVLVFEGLLGLLVLYWYLRTLWAALFEPAERETIWWVLAFVALFVEMLASAVMGASAFTRERETNTWESLNLSLLTPAEIIKGKLIAPLLACLVYSLPLWPLLLPCIHGITRTTGTSAKGIALMQAVGTVLVIAMTAWCYTAFGMFCSWRARSTTTAVGSTIGGIFVGLTFVPILLTIMFDRIDIGHFYHPIIALAKIVDAEGSVSLSALSSGLLLFGIGYGFLMLLHTSIRTNINERDPIAQAREQSMSHKSKT